MKLLEVWIDAAAATLLHSLWQGLVVALVLAGVLRICPRSRPEWRCRMAMLALATLAVWMLQTFFQALPMEQETAKVSTALASTGAIEEATASGVISAIVEPDTSSLWQTVLVGSWLLGAGFYAIRLIRGALGLATLQRQSLDVADVDILHCFERVSRRVGVRQQVILRTSDRIDSPLTFGWLRPVILVPASLLSALPVTHLEAIFAHELMHVRRSDYLFNLLLSAFRSAMFFHPAVWWMAKIVQSEREMTCDLGALKSLHSSPSGYASALLAIEEWRDGCQRDSMASVPMAMSMRAGDSLLERVERLALARQRGSISSPLNVPVMIIFVAASISVMVGWQMAGNRAYHLASGGQDSTRIVVDLPFSLSRGEIDIALDLLKNPGSWSSPASEGRLMRPPLILAVNGVARPFGKNDPPVFGDIPNAWLLKYGLNYLDVGVCDRDLDRDGFSAAEEYAADTNPVDALSHPPLIDKLRFVELRQQLYRVEFAARPDADTFQINRLPSARWTQKTMLLSIGGMSEDGQLELLSWDGDGLAIRFRETGQICDLRKGERADLSVDFAILELNIGAGDRYTVREGNSFVPGAEGGVWTLDAVGDSHAELVGSDGQRVVKSRSTSQIRADDQ